MMSFETHLAQQMTMTKIEFQYCQFPFPRRIDKQHTFSHSFRFNAIIIISILQIMGLCLFEVSMFAMSSASIFEWQQYLCTLGTLHIHVSNIFHFV